MLVEAIDASTSILSFKGKFEFYKFPKKLYFIGGMFPEIDSGYQRNIIVVEDYFDTGKLLKLIIYYYFNYYNLLLQRNFVAYGEQLSVLNFILKIFRVRSILDNFITLLLIYITGVRR